MTFTEVQAALAAIRNLPICEINKRQPMLVDLLVSLVNYETEGGKATQSDRALESQSWWLTLGERASDAGFERLGNGHFSAVYRHEMLPGRVIKVGFKKEDSGAAYAAFCRMNQGREGIPTIHDIQRHAGCYTVVLDELEPLKDWCRGESDKISHHFSAAHALIEWDDHREADKYPISEGFIKTCEDIRKFFHGIASFDCHSGNMMKTKDGQHLIITDPVSFSVGAKLKPGVFHCDADELLAEIEELKAVERIERCKARKAKRNPESTFRMRLKARAKRRRFVAKRDERNRKALLKMRADAAQDRRVAAGAVDYMGEMVWRQMWLHNRNSMVREVERVKFDKKRQHDHKAIAWGIPQGLHIDKQLDKMLMG